MIILPNHKYSRFVTKGIEDFFTKRYCLWIVRSTNYKRIPVLGTSIKSKNF